MNKTSSGSSASGTRLYALDEIGRPLGVYVVDSSASNGYRVEEEYVHLDGWRPVAVVRPDASTGMANPKIFPILTDHLGTPRKVLDGDTGETRWSWDAKQPFGHELPNETPSTGQPVFAFDLRFPGQRYDNETGLFHNGFRDYHPALGRYVQSDPLGLEAGWNTFAYVGMNPIGNTDTYGLSARDVKLIKQHYMEKQIWNTLHHIRWNGSGSTNNFMRGVYDHTGIGFKYQICTEQSTNMIEHLSKIKNLDDPWTFTTMGNENHQWLVGTSRNPADPILYIDPWGGYFVENDLSKCITCVPRTGILGGMNNYFVRAVEIYYKVEMYLRR